MNIDEVVLTDAPAAGMPCDIAVRCRVTRPIVFDLECCIDFFGDDPNVALHESFYTHHGGDVEWLPSGTFEFVWHTDRFSLPPGCKRICARIFRKIAGRLELLDVRNLPFPDAGGMPGVAMSVQWWLAARSDSPPIETLSWRQGHRSWFYGHFDWAAKQVVETIGGNHPLWRGRILDVGCGDGITDLGILLRYEPAELIGVDPFKGYERLRDILDRNHLASLPIPDNLRFFPHDANDLPFADDSFDAIISWGSIEHMAGGYAKALTEMRRVLKPDGILFITPGLYYSNIGHHLTEFTTQPYAHLEMEPAALRELVLNTPPNYMDRAGEFSPPAQFWQWYTELNPITVDGLEREMRALGFEPWRFAIRDEELVEYTPKLQRYSMSTLSQRDMYASWFNRKRR